MKSNLLGHHHYSCPEKHCRNSATWKHHCFLTIHGSGKAACKLHPASCRKKYECPSQWSTFLFMQSQLFSSPQEVLHYNTTMPKGYRHSQPHSVSSHPDVCSSHCWHVARFALLMILQWFLLGKKTSYVIECLEKHHFSASGPPTWHWQVNVFWSTMQLYNTDSKY